MAASSEERVLILAPRGRDAAVIEGVLAHDGLTTAICDDLGSLIAGLHEAAGAALVTEESLVGDDLAKLFAWLVAQEPWSDFPFILLATKQLGRRSAAASDVVARLGNVVLLERPINSETLASAVEAALRGRRRQYQARSHLAERERVQSNLRVVNETLEARVRERTHEVEAARETLAFALESAEMGSWDLDLLSNISRRSPRHDLIFGYAEPIPHWNRETFIAHVVEEERDTAAGAFAGAIATGTLDLECRIRLPEGGIRSIVARGRVEYDDDGTPVRMAGIVMDRTSQRLTEDALRQAQKMEAIGQLTGGVAHDFNNLLTVIVGGLDMMMRRPTEAERVKRLAEAAMTAARRGEQLTQQLLAFSRRQMLRPQTLDPNRLLLDFRPLAERAAGSAIEIVFDLEPAIDAIRIDPAQFEAAVLNLIVNARDAMDGGSGSPRIEVVSRNVALTRQDVADRGIAAGPYVRVSVADHGSGMDAATLQHVFEPFFTTKDVGKGSGLGLAQVYGFAHSAGGYAAIDSAPGRGTRVDLFFPRSNEAAEDDVSTASNPNLPLRRGIAGETVLLVEDDEQVLGMAIESLGDLHYEVVVARNAAEALDHLRSGARIDIMFSDVVMPGGMNGAQLATEGRRLRPDLKILLTSGYVAELDEGQTLARGELPVLGKPYRREDLARTLRDVLGEPAV